MIIVAAVDRSDWGTEVVREAAALARAFDEPLHVVHVVSQSEFLEVELESAEERGTPVEMDRIREAAADYARAAAEGVDVPYEAVGRVGKPANEVVKYADSRDARYVVVGGRKRSPAGKVIFGSVAQDVLLNASQSVVAVLERD